IMQKARQIEKTDPEGALNLLKTAESICQDLPGLRDYSLQLNHKYPILYVGVHELPEEMSPATAYTDSEKQAVELQFESLIRIIFNRALGQRYEVGLAEDLP